MLNEKKKLSCHFLRELLGSLETFYLCDKYNKKKKIEIQDQSQFFTYIFVKSFTIVTDKLFFSPYTQIRTIN